MNVCFYFPYFKDAGVNVLFSRMAKSLSVSGNFENIYVVDYLDGSIARSIAELPGVILIEFRDGHTVNIPEKSILVMQSLLPYNWPKELNIKSNQLLFFWNLHPWNLVPSLLPLPGLRDLPRNSYFIYCLLSIFYIPLLYKIRSFVKNAISSNSLAFMDESNANYTFSHLFLRYNEVEFLPVPGEVPAASKTIPLTSMDKIDFNIAWLGRLCDFKSPILIYTLEKINGLAREYDNRKFKVFIIGDGPLESLVKRATQNLKNIEIEFIGHKSLNEVRIFLSSNVDMLFAMGTSALEGASFGIPTCLLDFTSERVRGDYIFRMLYDTKNFDLGHSISNSDISKENRSLNNIFSKVLFDYSSESKKTYDYFVNNHTIDVVNELLSNKLLESRLTYEDISSDYLKLSKLVRVYKYFRTYKG